MINNEGASAPVLKPLGACGASGACGAEFVFCMQNLEGEGSRLDMQKVEGCRHRKKKSAGGVPRHFFSADIGLLGG